MLRGKTVLLGVTGGMCRFNPVLELLERARWDGKDRLEELFSILSLPRGDTLSRILISKWLMQSVAMARNQHPGAYGADGLLVLNGGQGIGKTTLVKKLGMRPDLYKLGQWLDVKDKDTFRRCTSAWIVELGELETTLRSDLERLKAFITAERDEYRLPYGRADRVLVRRTSLIATCNTERFLIDPTGSRRFWTVPLDTIDLDALGDGEAHLAVEMDAAIWEREFTGMVKGDIWGYDLRSMDAREADLSVVEDWNEVSFSTDTLWPDPLPEGFSPEEILEFNKNPGLSVRDLHRQGFTGKGVGLAIIDQGLYTGHEEYAQNLKSYELIHCINQSAQMHGPAVASIAVGRTVGVAPEADLYYIASTFGHNSDEGYQFDASIMAGCILRVCEMNKHLPQENRIRVISISKGYEADSPGYHEIRDAIRQADEQGILVLTTSTKDFYPFTLFGLGRGYFDDPDDPASYGPMPWAPTTYPAWYHLRPHGLQGLCRPYRAAGL